MKLMMTLLVLLLVTRQTLANNWVTEKHPTYDMHYTLSDQQYKGEYLNLINTGVKNVAAFFGASYKKRFDVFIHPDRISFDKAYQKNYKQPNFKSECWLVATGDAYRINIISPNTWHKETCDSRYTEYTDKIKTQKLITHELVHVYHGQLNTNPDLNKTDGLDWFMEGLAYYASGQLNLQELKAVKKAIIENKVPNSLDAIASYPDINLRYSLSGSLVRYIDRTYGRIKLKSILGYNKKTELLAALKITGPKLLNNWKKNLLQ